MKKITKIEVVLTEWSEHYPTGCVLYHYNELVDSEFCDNAEEFIEFIGKHKDEISPWCNVNFVFGGYDLEEESARECAKKVWEYVYGVICRKENRYENDV